MFYTKFFNPTIESIMKITLLFLCFMLAFQGLNGQEPVTREDFANYNLVEVNFLPSVVTYGKFTYEFRKEGQLVDSSSVVTVFENDGSLFVGLGKQVTDFLIKTAEGEEFGIKAIQLSTYNDYPGRRERVEVTGRLNGRAVTEPVELIISTFEAPGQTYDFSHLEGFDTVDEINIKGEKLEFILECFTYQ